MKIFCSFKDTSLRSQIGTIQCCYVLMCSHRNAQMLLWTLELYSINSLLTRSIVCQVPYFSYKIPCEQWTEESSLFSPQLIFLFPWWCQTEEISPWWVAPLGEHCVTLQPTTGSWVSLSLCNMWSPISNLLCAVTRHETGGPGATELPICLPGNCW